MNNDFKKNIETFAEQLGEKNLSARNLKRLDGGTWERVVIMGIGGSGLAGDILRSAQDEIGLKAPIVIWKDYGLPKIAGNAQHSLYIFVSFSGDTEETLSGLRAILKNGKKPGGIAAITTGGELERIAKIHGLPIVMFPPGTLTPRQATGMMFYSLIKVLRSAGFKPSVPAFERLRLGYAEREGKALARNLQKKLIVVYTDQRHKDLGYIWKIKFNETAKTLAFANVIPEMNHNEIVGFERKQTPAAALFLRDATLSPRLNKRFAVTEKLLKARGVSTHTIKLIGKNLLEKTWRTIAVADWTSYYLALANHIDPKETRIIDTLKRTMK